MREAALRFPADTGVGADNVAARALASLPSRMLDELAALLNQCEDQGGWPERWQLVLIVLLPKPDGGKRPIGLFPSVFRLWMRARAASLRSWEQRNERPGLFGGSGMSAAKAAWTSAWEAEAASTKSGLYGQTLLDLVKAFESVPHEQLWRAADKHNYPMPVLRLALAASRMPRSVGCEGAYSRLVCALEASPRGQGQRRRNYVHWS